MARFGNPSVIVEAQKYWNFQPIFLDTETTGLHQHAEVIEICLLDFDATVLYQSLVKPRRLIPSDVIRLHGITNEMVADAPNWLQVWSEIEAILHSRHAGIYNAEFDLRMFQQSHFLNGLLWRPPPMRVFDIMKLYAEYRSSPKWLKLEEAGRQCKLPLQNTHRAYDDALLAREVFLTILRGG